jgi:hypothetical protein
MTLDIGLAARLIAGIRATTGAPAWDTAGIAAALRDVGGTPGAAFAAAALAAEDTSLHKPSAKAFAQHWPQNAGVTAPRTSYDVHCPEHPLSVHPCPQCAAKKCTPDPVEHADYLAAKAALRGRQGPAPREQRYQPTPTEELARARARADKGTKQ